MTPRDEPVSFASDRARSAAWAMFVALVLGPSSAGAKWSPYGAALAVGGGNQLYSLIASDAAGGAIIAWRDSRGGSEDIYAQRVDAWGNPLWATSGVPVCTAAADQFVNAIVEDGSGGAIILWGDYRSDTSGDMYAQRVNASGAALWTPDGVAVCTASGFQFTPVPSIASDGSGGTIVVWEDYRSGIAGVYARRIDASGTPLWTPDGVALGGPLGANRYSPVVVADGVGGAIVSWEDWRSGAGDIYAQRVDAAGATLWSPNGVALCAATNNQGGAWLVSDGASGAIVAWSDYRFGSSYDVYVQRVDASGTTRWAVDGLPVCTASNTQSGVAISADGSGGAVLAWYDYRGSSADIYGQRVDAAGGFHWQASGLAVCDAANNQFSPHIEPDGSGGAIIAWHDDRTGSRDLYAQRVSSVGIAQWTPNGTAMSTGSGVESMYAMTSDGAGNVLAAWHENRGGVTYAAYAQRIEGTYGAWGHPEPEVASVADVPNDQGGVVAVNWNASGRDLPTPRTIDAYSIWRAVDAIPAANAGSALHSPAELPRGDLRSSDPVYLVASPPAYYWELVGTQPAHGWPAYSFSTPTRADSVSGDPGTEYFMVAAHYLYDDYVAFASNAESGHSTDNLAPPPPLMLVADRFGPDVVLHWNRVATPDLRDYAVYRAGASGVEPLPASFLTSAAETVLVDANAPTSALYYIVTALDVHANQSLASNETNVGAATSVEGLSAGARLAVLPNRPNPFANGTAFAIGLPERSDIVVEIYDVAGRAVRTLSAHGSGPGWVQIPFDGRNEEGILLSSGVAFYRVTANGATITRKMVIAR